MRRLDRRLKTVYRSAEQTAVEQLKKAESRLMAFKAAPDVPPQFYDQALYMHMLRVDRETGLLQNIAHDLSRTSEMAGQMIRGESLQIYEHGYKSTISNITAQLGKAGINVSWSETDRNTLNAVFNGRNTNLGTLPGYQASFEQVKSRQVYIRGMTADGRRGTYFYQRALGNLGDKTNLVRQLQNQLGRSLLLGESIPQIATKIRAITEGCRRQAVRIARTECLRALNQGHMLCHYEAENIGIPVKKKWISTNDDRTRESHSYLDGEEVDSDDTFSNGLAYPHDPNGEPEEIINCRCTFVSIVDTNLLANAGDSAIVDDTHTDIDLSGYLEDGDYHSLRDGTEIDNIKRLPENVEKQAQEIIRDMRKEFPDVDLERQIKGVYVGDISREGTTGILLGKYDSEKGYVFIDNRVLSGAVKTDLLIDSSVKGVLTHEMSHGISYAPNKQFGNLAVLDAHKKSGTLEDVATWARSISPYAAVDPGEAFAEAMTDYLTNRGSAKEASRLIVNHWKNSTNNITIIMP